MEEEVVVSFTSLLHSLLPKVLGGVLYQFALDSGSVCIESKKWIPW
jgi:hypothetical protein